MKASISHRVDVAVYHPGTREFELQVAPRTKASSTSQVLEVVNKPFKFNDKISNDFQASQTMEQDLYLDNLALRLWPDSLFCSILDAALDSRPIHDEFNNPLLSSLISYLNFQ